MQSCKFAVRFLPLLLFAAFTSQAQTCLTSGDMDEATRSALVSAAQHDFDLLAHGDSASLKQASSASLASDFSGIESVVQENHANLSQIQASPRPPFLLKTDTTSANGEFLCGVFGARGQTADSAEFVIPNLPAGSYGIIMLDAAAKAPVVVTLILLQQNSAWKLAGLYVKNTQVAGHDAKWFADKAREFVSKGERRDAWLYFLEARDLALPVQFMTTQIGDKLYDESQANKPTDLPDAGPVELASGANKYQLTAIFPTAVGDDLDLVAKYQSPDVSNTAKTFQENEIVMKALLAKYPEFRDAFAGIVVRAVEPSGKDYGSMMSMKDIK